MPRQPFWHRLARSVPAARGTACAVDNPVAQVRALDMATLEDRLLFSAGPIPIDADVAPGGVDTTGIDLGIIPDVPTAIDPPLAADALPVEDKLLGSAVDAQFPELVDLPNGDDYTRREVVFVDTAAASYQQLIDDLLGEEGGERQFEVYLIDQSEDGLAKITEVLTAHQDLDAVHLVSHGTEGRVQLGNGWLDIENVADHGEEFAVWNKALRDGADLLIYGCDLASNAEGRALVEALGVQCDCDVAATVDDTGHTSLGGNWDLEFAVGSIDTSIAFSRELESEWLSVLATGTLYAESDAYPEGSLKAVAPVQPPPPADYDGDDSEPGAQLKKTGEQFGEGDNLEYLQWLSNTPVYLNGPASFTVYAAPKDWTPSGTGSITAYLIDCANDGSDCQIISQGWDTNAAWSGIPNDFHQFNISFNPFAPYVVGPGRSLGVKIINDDLAPTASTIDMWVSYDTTLEPTRLIYDFAGGSAAPTISDLAGDTLVYVEDQGPVAIDQGTAATLLDADTDPLDGGLLFVDIIAGEDTSDDVLSIQDNGPLSFSGGAVFDGATQFGTVTGGSGGTPLRIALDSDATQARVQMLLQNITYENTDNLNPSNSGRTVRFWLHDGEGGFSTTNDTTINVFDNILVVDTASDVIDAPDASSIASLLSDIGTDGRISLREAIEATNGTTNVGDLDEIHFGIAGGGPHTIQVGNLADGNNGPLPTISDAVIIDGYTQTGATANSLAVGNNADLRIELDGTNAGAGMNGLTLGVGGGGSTIRGLVVNRFDNFGIYIQDVDGNTIEGNFLGTDVTGTLDPGLMTNGLNLNN
ncbi:MAG: DUF4347 domain-containing protein, partial [Aeoliella sp.]